MYKLSALLIALLLTACTKSPTMEVETTSCIRTLTGVTRDDPVTSFQCFSYDKDMQCNVTIPITTYIRFNEVEYTCNFKRFE